MIESASLPLWRYIVAEAKGFEGSSSRHNARIVSSATSTAMRRIAHAWRL